MNLTDAPLGYGFEGDYPESYGLYAAGLRAIVAQQVGRLTGTSSTTPAAPRSSSASGMTRRPFCGPAVR
jgi:hypothetical protein